MSIKAKLTKIEKELEGSFRKEPTEDDFRLLKLMYSHKSQKFLERIWQKKYNSSTRNLVEDTSEFFKKSLESFEQK